MLYTYVFFCLQTQRSRQNARESSDQYTNPASFVFESDLLADRVRVPALDTTATNHSRPGLTRTSSEPVLHDGSYSHDIFHASPHTRGHDSHRHDIFHASPRGHDNSDDALDYIGDDLEIPERIEINDAETNMGYSYSIENETNRENRDTRSRADAPPSYNEATAADGPPFKARATAPSLNTLDVAHGIEQLDVTQK